MASPAEPMLAAIAHARWRKLCARSNGQFVLTLTDVPVCWKTELPQLESDLEVPYARGLFDGDGCFSAARVGGRAYPYASLCFNPLQEQWIGDFYCDFLDRHAIDWRLQMDKPTVVQVRSWSREALAVADLLYRGEGLAHPEKAQRALELRQRLGIVKGRPGWPPDLFRV